MTYMERNNVVAIITNILVISFFAWRIYQMHREGAFDGPNGLSVWAQTSLWLIPVSLVVTIVLTIFANMLFGATSGGEALSMIVDERDKLIGLRGMTATMIVISAGFIGSIVALAFGWVPLVVFNIILFSFAAGDLLGNVVKFVLYRAA